MATFSWVSLFTNQVTTLTNFITDARSRVDEDVADTVTDIIITAWICQGIRDISLKTGLKPQYATVTLDGSSTYTLPSKLSSLGRVEWRNSSGVPTTLVELSYDETYKHGVSTASPPQYFIRNGNSDIEIYGNTSSDGTLRLYGVKIPDTPVSGSDYIDLPEQYLELLFRWVIYWFFVRKRVPDEATYHWVEYEKTIKIFQDDIQKNYSAGVSLYGDGTS